MLPTSAKEPPRRHRNIFKPKQGKVFRSKARKAKENKPQKNINETQQRRLATIARKGTVLSKHTNLYPGKALREIKYYQSAAFRETLVLPHAAFKKVVKEIIENFARSLRFQLDALTALQWATEHFMILFMEMRYRQLID